jgi:hypothetical protein
MVQILPTSFPAQTLQIARPRGRSGDARRADALDSGRREGFNASLTKSPFDPALMGQK